MCDEPELVLPPQDNSLSTFLGHMPLITHDIRPSGILTQHPSGDVDISKFFLNKIDHTFVKLPVFHSSNPFLPKEAPLFHSIMKTRLTKQQFEVICRNFPESFTFQFPQHEKWLVFQNWQRTEEIVSLLKVPIPWRVFKRSPIYAISDNLRRMAEKKSFWEKLVRGPEDFEKIPENKKKLMKKLFDSEKLKEILTYSQREGAIPILLTLYLDDFELNRFSPDKTYCGYYSHITNLYEPILSEVRDSFLVSLSPSNVEHNDILLIIFEELNFLFKGIELFNPITQQFQKCIVFLWQILADSPERNALTCTMNYNANQGCFNCDFHLRENNFLFEKVTQPKTFEDYLKTGEELRSKCWDYECRSPQGTLTKISEIQSTTGFKFVKLDERATDVTNKKEKKYLTDYFQESPLITLDQVKLRLFDFKNVVIAPFHTIQLGLMKVTLPWIFAECQKAPLEALLDKLNLPSEVEFWTHDHYQDFLNHYKEFCLLMINAEKKTATMNFYEHIFNLVSSQVDVVYDEFFVAKKAFFLVFAASSVAAENRPKFHFLDHVVLQVGETGPVKCKNEVAGEAYHQILRNCAENVNHRTYFYSVCNNRHVDWLIDMMEVK